MGDRREEDADLSAIAWPGFVDILSAVIIMFVFFVLITAVALYVHTITYISKEEPTFQVQMDEPKPVEVTEDKEEIGQGEALSKDSDTEIEQLRRKIVVLEEQLEEVIVDKEVLENVVAEIEDDTFQAKTLFTESIDQKVIENYENDPRSILIFFGADAISITEETKAIVDDFMNNIFAQTPQNRLRVEILGGKNPQSPIQSVARKVTVARMLNVRNLILETQISANEIKVRTDNSGKTVENTHHWVVLSLRDINE